MKSRFPKKTLVTRIGLRPKLAWFLVKRGVKTLGDIIDMGYNGLHDLPGVGPSRIHATIEAVRKCGWSWGRLPALPIQDLPEESPMPPPPGTHRPRPVAAAINEKTMKVALAIKPWRSLDHEVGGLFDSYNHRQAVPKRTCEAEDIDEFLDLALTLYGVHSEYLPSRSWSNPAGCYIEAIDHYLREYTS